MLFVTLICGAEQQAEQGTARYAVALSSSRNAVSG